jgi:hypothetical protein
MRRSKKNSRAGPAAPRGSERFRFRSDGCRPTFSRGGYRTAATVFAAGVAASAWSVIAGVLVVATQHSDVPTIVGVVTQVRTYSVR